VNLVVFLRARLADLTAEQGKALSDLTLAENQRQARPGQARTWTRRRSASPIAGIRDRPPSIQIGHTTPATG